MPIRSLLSATACAALAAAPAPAMAHRDAAVPMIESLGDPATQQTMAAMVRALTAAVLDARVAPLARAIDSAHGGDGRNVDPDARLRDYAGPEAERLPDEAARRLPAMMDALSHMAGALAAAMPAMEAIGRDVADSLDQAGRP